MMMTRIGGTSRGIRGTENYSEAVGLEGAVSKVFRNSLSALFSSRRDAQCILPNESVIPILLGVSARKHSRLNGKMIEILSPIATRHGRRKQYGCLKSGLMNPYG